MPTFIITHFQITNIRIWRETEHIHMYVNVSLIFHPCSSSTMASGRALFNSSIHISMSKKKVKGKRNTCLNKRNILLFWVCVCVWVKVSIIVYFMPLPVVAVLMTGHRQYSNERDRIPESGISCECVYLWFSFAVISPARNKVSFTRRTYLVFYKILEKGPKISCKLRVWRLN